MDRKKKDHTKVAESNNKNNNIKEDQIKRL